MLTFEEILAIESEFVKEHKLPVCIVPFRYLEARYGIKGNPDELCFFVYSTRESSASLPTKYHNVSVFYVEENTILQNKIGLAPSYDFH